MAAIEAVLNLDKTAILANCPAARRDLRMVRLQGAEENLKVAHDVRDLGAHINTIRAARSGTMKRRGEEVLPLANRLRYMPAPRSKKAQVVSGKIYPKALYGCEVITPPANLLRDLAPQIIGAF